VGSSHCQDKPKTIKSITSICSIGETWSDDSTDVFDEMTYAAKWKVLMAKKVSEHQTRTGTVPVVELVDTNTDQVSQHYC
jgi:tudor domain-containing protein 2